MRLSTAGSFIIAVTSCAVITPLLVDADILRFGGPDPNTVDYSATRTTLPDVTSTYLVFLPNQVTNSSSGGMLYAFQAYVIRKFQQFYFQIYRPNGLRYTRIFSLPVSSSVVNQTEAFYLASYLGTQPCVYVQPGDRLALTFDNKQFPVLVYWWPNDPQIRLAVVTDPSISSVQFTQPYVIAASAFYDTNAMPPSSSDNVDVTCDTSIRIPSQFQPTTVPPTSTTPYVAIIGNTGATGPTGPKGSEGNTGLPGADSLSVGVKGSSGLSPPGLSGLTGPRGEKGTDNFYVGATGYKGETGLDGDIGLIGDQGIAGNNGSLGPMGNNETVVIKGPYAGLSRWLQPSSIQGCYIWLSIISFVFIVAVVFTIVTLCIKVDLDDALKR